ncbi:MAG: nuclear transport factor 2 family protein [Saprospiraceae bacterium]
MRTLLSSAIGLFFLTTLVYLNSCATTPNPGDADIIRKQAKAYYAVYAVQKDFDAFMNFYDEHVVLEDIVNGDRIEGKAALQTFFNWDVPGFERMDSVALVIEDQLVDQNKVVTTGYFTPFKWEESLVEAMHFTSILHFNPEGKIIRQTDWINYPAWLVDYENRKNSNAWIPIKPSN